MNVLVVRLGGVDQRREHVVVRHGRDSLGFVALGRSLVLGRAVGDDHVADLDAFLQRAGRPDADERLDADRLEFLDGDGRRRRTDAGRTDRQFAAVVGRVDELVLAVLRDDLVVVAEPAMRSTRPGSPGTSAMSVRSPGSTRRWGCFAIQASRTELFSSQWIPVGRNSRWDGRESGRASIPRRRRMRGPAGIAIAAGSSSDC